MRAIKNHRRGLRKQYANFGSPIAHFDASTLGLSNGASVTSWTDSAGIQGAYSVTAGAPTYTTASQNGLGVISCLANVIMTNTWAVVPTNPCTLIIAGGLDVVQTTDPWHHQTFDMQMFTNGLEWDLACGGDLHGPPAPDTTFHIFTFMYNGASSIVRIDGVQTLSGNAGASAATGASATLKGPFRHGEFYFYNSNAIALGTESFLRTKWGTA